MSADDDTLVFAEEAEPPPSRASRTWKVLIVDDEPQVHSVTRLALRDVRFVESALQFLSAYSGKEAEQVLQEHQDIALVLLDIVMETNDAGLRVADFIRNQLQNREVRIILRTGQPGNVPERDVINNYEINDYKTKTDLTAQKLYTVVMTALRSYRDLRLVEAYGEALEWLVEAERQLFEQHRREAFISVVETQLRTFLGRENTGGQYWVAEGNSGQAPLQAASDNWREAVGRSLGEVLPAVASQLDAAQPLESGPQRVESFHLIVSAPGEERPLLVGWQGETGFETDQEAQLLTLWAQSLEAAYVNLRLSEETQAHQAALEHQVDEQRCQLNERCEELERIKAVLTEEQAQRERLQAILKSRQGAS